MYIIGHFCIIGVAVPINQFLKEIVTALYSIDFDRRIDVKTESNHIPLQSIDVNLF
ncbi:5974_t:CDS:1, partial [Acaulospora morrowiae]